MTAATMSAADYQRTMTEAQFQRAVVEAAERLGWPDLILIHDGTVLFVELKRETGKLSPKQTEWRDRLESVGADVRLWRPSMWPEIAAILSGEHDPATTATEGRQATNDHANVR